jgi:uncharacterized pyridoxal phosphate-containing UPF0001 family protein
MGGRQLIHAELFAKLNAEISKDRESTVTCDGSIPKQTASVAELYNEVQSLDSTSLAEAVSKLEVRSRELECALQIKESAMEKLATINSNLQKEMRVKDAMRLSQIELLAIRNLELEKELSQFREVEPPTTI